MRHGGVRREPGAAGGGAPTVVSMSEPSLTNRSSARPSVGALLLAAAIAAVVFVAAAAILALSGLVIEILAAALSATVIVVTLSAVAGVATFLWLAERERRRALAHAVRRERVLAERHARQPELFVETEMLADTSPAG